MKRIIRLTESDLRRIVRRVIKEDKDPFTPIYGKTAIFKTTGVDGITIRDDFNKDQWTGNELDRETFGKGDEYVWEHITSEPIKGTITKITPMTQGELRIEFTPLDSRFPDLRENIYIYYTCDENKFDVTYEFGLTNRWFTGKRFYGKYTNQKLSNFLNNNLPCGNFDLSKSDSMGDDVIPDTLS